ncbi:MAG: hypothetical protein WAW85_02215 [Gordonia sp. (in: high G+C Gram-positive bacteria)]|uniref:hypothetical protein n=1 Tax=Gordonia sp. (in: high G+C Gram-positive bacteria) TaxID=84139 RepID=UPI003BB6EC3A
MIDAVIFDDAVSPVEQQLFRSSFAQAEQVLDDDELTTIERRMVGQGIREIDSVRRRMERIAGLART